MGDNIIDNKDDSAAAATAAAAPPSDEVIKAHIEHLVRTNLPNSAIYAFLLSDVRIASATRGRFRARLALTQRHVNSGGGLHGAVSAAITDWAGGMAVATWDLRARTGVSVDIHVRYLASARAGDEVEIEGVAEKVGGAIAFTRVVISKIVRDGDGDGDGEAGPVVASGTHTKYVKAREPLPPPPPPPPPAPADG
ncbi:putative thioesterase family protein [Rosellinia necatrix]|uniref:Putative thioesterase family protein n=1 Tax=Rosellinia necatrix TaxID=77044 RepID=A0A1W2TAQ5_ROSNE|nr:putative thioesterase family protein [Rosellinia necatrix]